MDLDTYTTWLFRAIFAVFALAFIGIIVAIFAAIYLAATTTMGDVAVVAGEAVKVFREAAQ